MTFDRTLYAKRDQIKAAIRSLNKRQGEVALVLGYVPSTFSNKLNGLMAMDSAEEKKILSDIQAMGVER